MPPSPKPVVSDMAPTLKELHERFEGPVPRQHLLPPDHHERTLRHAIKMNSSLADQFDRSAEQSSDVDYRLSCQRNAKWHRDEVIRLELELNPLAVAAE